MAQKQQELGTWKFGKGRLRHTLKGHQDRVLRMAWSPKGELLATPSDDGTIRIWDGRAGTLLHVLRGHQLEVLQVAWSPTAPLLASVSFEGSVIIWSTETWTPFRVLREHRRGIATVAWSPQGAHLVTADGVGVLRVWDSIEWHQVAETSFSTVVYSAVWSPDGKRIAVGTGVGVFVLDTNLKREFRFEDLRRGVFCLQWRPGSEQLVIAGRAGPITILNGANPGQQVSYLTLEGHTSAVKSISFSPDGHFMASMSVDQTVRL
jgi:WD40 repeat protein